MNEFFTPILYCNALSRLSPISKTAQNHLIFKRQPTDFIESEKSYFKSNSVKIQFGEGIDFSLTFLTFLKKELTPKLIMHFVQKDLLKKRRNDKS